MGHKADKSRLSAMEGRSPIEGTSSIDERPASGEREGDKEREQTSSVDEVNALTGFETDLALMSDSPLETSAEWADRHLRAGFAPKPTGSHERVSMISISCSLPKLRDP